MNKHALVLSLIVSFAFLAPYAFYWYYTIFTHGSPYFAVVEPVMAIWLPESFLIAFALIYMGYAMIQLSKPKGDEKESDSG